MGRRLRNLRAAAGRRWPGPIQATGFALGILEFGGKLLVNRPIDGEVIPFAVALILWRPVARRQDQRNARRRRDADPDDPDGGSAL